VFCHLRWWCVREGALGAHALAAHGVTRDGENDEFVAGHLEPNLLPPQRSLARRVGLAAGVAAVGRFALVSLVCRVSASARGEVRRGRGVGLRHAPMAKEGWGFSAASVGAAAGTAEQPRSGGLISATRRPQPAAAGERGAQTLFVSLSLSLSLSHALTHTLSLSLLVRFYSAAA
jgi:hypothetical protein